VPLTSSPRLTVRTLDFSAQENLCVINEETAKKIGATLESRLMIRLDNLKAYYFGVIISGKGFVNKDEIGIPRDIAQALGLKDGDNVNATPVNVSESIEIIRNKLKGKKLSREEISKLIRDVVNGALDEAGIAAFLSAQEAVGMDDDELYYLTLEMATQGTVLSHPYPVYDEHSIGGVPGNSKVALVAVPTAIAFGIKIPKTSSRAIVSPSGTADTMEVLARVDLTADEIKQALVKVGGTLAWTGRLNLSPADDIFVRTERKLRIDPESQMIASILSKKVAMGVSGLVIDIPTGEGAKVSTINEAERLASRFLMVTNKLKISSKVLITFGGEPIGFTVGPALEAREALETLMKKSGPPSLVHKALSIVAALLELSGKANYGEGLNLARSMFESGKPELVFRKMIEFQGGNPEVKPEDISLADFSYTIKAPFSGAVTKINNNAVNIIARAAGAPFDKKAGVMLHAKIGYRVDQGDPLLTIYSSSANNLNKARELAESLAVFEIGHMVLKSIP
jgi:AMP phosphorylase